MGWKSTVIISREQAVQLIIDNLGRATDSQIADALEFIGYGDDPELLYYGFNFIVKEVVDEKDNEHLFGLP